jgi:hypothetical protein
VASLAWLNPGQADFMRTPATAGWRKKNDRGAIAQASRRAHGAVQHRGERRRRPLGAGLAQPNLPTSGCSTSPRWGGGDLLVGFVNGALVIRTGAPSPIITIGAMFAVIFITDNVVRAMTVGDHFGG